MTDTLLNHALYIRFVNAPEGEIEGCLAVWGSPEQRDAYDTWFDRNQPPDLGLKGGEFLPIRLMFEHGYGDLAKEIIGKVFRVWADSFGIKFRAMLDKTSENFGMVVDQIEKGLLAVSTASAEHLADFDDEGRFVNWYLTEVSLTDSPAEPRMPKVALVRSNQLIVSSIDTPPTDGGDPGDAAGQPVADRKTVPAESISQHPISSDGGKPKMNKSAKRELNLEVLGLDATATPSQIYQAVVDMFGEETAKVYWQSLAGGAAAADPAGVATPELMSVEGRSAKTTPAKPEATGQISAEQIRALVEAELKKLQQTEPPAPTQPQVRTETPRISLGEELKYAGKTHSDLEFAYMVMRSRGIQPSEAFMRNLGGKVADAYDKGDKSLTHAHVRSVMPSTRANEIATSTASGGGDEWVKIDYASQLWETARNEADLIDILISKGMMVKEVKPGAESVDIPTEGADPTVYTISQNADASSNRPAVTVGLSRIGTGNKVLTPGELGAAVAWTDVFEEDSIVAVSPQYNKQCTTKLKETVVQLFLNGDTATGASTNINLIDGTPGTGLSTPYYIASDGALKYALVTGSNTSRDGTTLDENDYRLTTKLLSSAVRSRLMELLYIIDVDTHSASLDIAAIKTDDVRRTNATITSGVLKNIYGIDVYQTGFMALANSAGKIPNAGGTLGRILNVFCPYWAMGWKRHITVEADRDILSGANILVTKMRVGFKARGADAATASYNLTV